MAKKSNTTGSNLFAKVAKEAAAAASGKKAKLAEQLSKLQAQAAEVRQQIADVEGEIAKVDADITKELQTALREAGVAIAFGSATAKGGRKSSGTGQRVRRSKDEIAKDAASVEAAVKGAGKGGISSADIQKTTALEAKTVTATLTLLKKDGKVKSNGVVGTGGRWFTA